MKLIAGPEFKHGCQSLSVVWKFRP